MINVVVLTGSDIRHKAFAIRFMNSSKINVLCSYSEAESPLKKSILTRKKIDDEILYHLEERNQVEKDIFGWFLDQHKHALKMLKVIKRGGFSDKDFLEEIKELNPQLILVYGTSLLKGEIINKFRNKIINVHLGLSPYYRGSGTGYFPFVNNEPEYCGATFMFLDEGIDTGRIIHQIRPNIYPRDSFHLLSIRFLKDIFDTYVSIIENYSTIQEPLKFGTGQNKTNKYYKRSDFNLENLYQLWKYFKSSSLKQYLDNKIERDRRVPILAQKKL